MQQEVETDAATFVTFDLGDQIFAGHELVVNNAADAELVERISGCTRNDEAAEDHHRSKETERTRNSQVHDNSPVVVRNEF